MRARTAIALALVASAAIALVAVLGRHAPAAGAVLVVRMAGSAAPEVAPQERSEARAMTLAVESMSPADRQKLIALLDHATTRLEAQLSPLGTDFEDGDPVEQLRKSLAPHMPAFTAARELERGAWSSPGLEVRAAATCVEAELAPGEKCIPLWSAPDVRGESSTDRQARFLAWAAARTTVVDLGTRERAQACARALRARSTNDASPIALVLSDDDLALRSEGEGLPVRDAAKRLGRAMAARGSRDTTDLEGFCREPVRQPIAPWLVLAPTALAIVPRLSALAETAALTKEIETAAAGPVRWVRHP